MECFNEISGQLAFFDSRIRPLNGNHRRHRLIKTRNSSGDEIANVNFLYDDIIVHAVKIQ